MSTHKSHHTKKQYSVKEKLGVLDEIKTKSIRATEKAHNIPESNIRKWKQQEKELRALFQNNDNKVRERKPLIGGGKKPEFENLEQLLYEFVIDRNKLGLVVKSKYIQIHAKTLRDDYVEDINLKLNEEDLDEDLKKELNLKKTEFQNFKASDSWCANLKKRFNLVRRTQTGCRKLPENFQKISCDYVAEAREIIIKHKVKPENVLNFDQIPRLFEHEPSNTIAIKGSKEIFLKKASTFHKKFTYTPTINAKGEFVNQHLLFSKLKNAPKVSPGFLVDVNLTGMWSEDLLKKYLREIILMRPATAIFKQATLLILDSYPVHVKVVNELRDKYADLFKVYFLLVPPNFTGLLQSIDVSLGKSFQGSYDEFYDAYVAKALNDKSLQTNKGNIRMPTYIELSSWIKEWSKWRSADDIAKCFRVVGAHPDVNPLKNPESLHEPLRKCFNKSFDFDKWLEQHQDLLEVPSNNFFDLNNDEWGFAKKPDSLWMTLYECTKSTDKFKSWKQSHIEKIVEFIHGDPILHGLYDDEEMVKFEKEVLSDSRVELSAFSKVLGRKLIFIVLNDSMEEEEHLTYENEQESEPIKILLFNNSYAYKKDD